MSVKAALAVLSAVLLATLITPASAQDRRDRERMRERERIERREVQRELWWGDIHRFRDHDMALWRSGQWLHATHNGRYGWWWVAGGTWYFYPLPVYPYPDPYVPPGVVAPVVGPGAPDVWYYCGNPQGYYPYVVQCAAPWQRVPAGAVVAAAPPAPVSIPAPPASPPVVTAIPPAPAPADWYYCDDPRGYYPSVARCAGGWRRVPASPPPG